MSLKIQSRNNFKPQIYIIFYIRFFISIRYLLTSFQQKGPAVRKRAPEPKMKIMKKKRITNVQNINQKSKYLCKNNYK